MLADSGIIDFNLTGVLGFVIFLITIAILWKVALGPVSRVIEQREEKIEAGVRAAEEAERRLQQVQVEVQKELDQARGQAREILARAHQDAVADAEEVRVRARRDAEAQLDKARTDIDAERDRAITELRSEVSSLVVEAASRVLGRTITADDHQRLIEESLSQVGGRDGSGSRN